MSSGKLTYLLALESSCDDTSVAVVRGRSRDDWPELAGWSVQSQDLVHERFGGVVPELASRAHLKNLIPCIEKALNDASIGWSEIDIVAATGQPGLVGSLLVGHTAAKTLSFLFEKPFISVNHIRGHLASVFIEARPAYPFVAAVVSGGHTSLYWVASAHEVSELGVTLDDAMGEAFDKGAKLLGLPFPGGAEIDRLSKAGDPRRYSFGRVSVPGLNFSFSGLKSELYRLCQREGESLSREDAAASYQRALVDHLLAKISSAVEEKSARRLALVGGVARNSLIRSRLDTLVNEGVIDEWFAPSPAFCTDNAVMIGFQAFQEFKAGRFSTLQSDVQSTSRPARGTRT